MEAAMRAQHWMCRYCPAMYHCAWGKLPIRSDDHEHGWVLQADLLPFRLGAMRHVDLLALLFTLSPGSRHELTVAQAHKGLLAGYVLEALDGKP